MLQPLALLSQLCLGLLLVIAATAKLNSKHALAQSVRELGFAPIAVPVSHLLPIAEALLGSLLILGFNQPNAEIASFTLLAMFTLVTYGAVRQGRNIACNCFGASREGFLDKTSLKRNILLVVVALVSMIRTEPIRLAVAEQLKHLVQVIGTAPQAWFNLIDVCLLILICIGVWSGNALPTRPRYAPKKQNGSRPRIPLGSPFPNVVLVDATNTERMLLPFIGEAKTLLVFLSPGCRNCVSLMTSGSLSRAQDFANIIAISTGGSDQNKFFSETVLAGKVFFQQSHELAVFVGISMTPSMLILQNGRIQSDIIEGRTAIDAELALLIHARPQLT